jgi:hypothetical protein
MFELTLAGGFRWLSLEQALNHCPVLPVRECGRAHLLVPVEAFRSPAYSAIRMFRYYIRVQETVKQQAGRG